MRAMFVSLLVAGLLATPASAKKYGPCGFDSITLRFAGTVDDTLSCLLKKVRSKGGGADTQAVPTWILQRATRPFPYSNVQLLAYARRHNFAFDQVSSRATAADVPAVRYFVIHDTSSPEISSASGVFPAEIDDPSWSGNNLSGWAPVAQKVNLIINRTGDSRTLRAWGQTRSSPATKLEQNSDVPAARPVFVHVENIQPRIKPPGSWAWKAPIPGLGPAQERRLAFAYFVASFHAGRWLIPAYHFNIDQGFADVHDDPQNMDLISWAAQLKGIEDDILSNP